MPEQYVFGIIVLGRVLMEESGSRDGMHNRIHILPAFKDAQQQIHAF